jgi:hypothetical protein
MRDTDRDSRDFSRWAETEYSDCIIMPALPISPSGRINRKEMDIVMSVAKDLYRRLGRKYSICVRVVENGS